VQKKEDERKKIFLKLHKIKIKANQGVVVCNIEDDIRVRVDQDIRSLAQEKVVMALLGSLGNSKDCCEILLGGLLRTNKVALVYEHRLRKEDIREEMYQCF